MFILSMLAEFFETQVTENKLVSSFAIDSREVERGGMFFALPGAKTDGHFFLQDVASRGAVAAVVFKGYTGPDFGMTLFKVDDVLLSLQRLAKSVLAERGTKVIGITGSVGKTTTKEFIYDLIAGDFATMKSVGNRNSQATLPLGILNSHGDEEYFVLEMGMTHAGQITKLIEIAPPKVVVMTQIVLCHAVNFKGIEEIAAAKAEIFSPETEFAVIHERSARFEAVKNACHVDNVIYPSFIDIPSPFTETHFTENFCAAYEVASYLGLSDERIRERSALLKPYMHRFEKKFFQGITFIDDAYNANEVSMKAALANLPKAEMGSKRIAVFGSMGELGIHSARIHEEVGKAAVQTVDMLFCIGDDCKIMVEIFQKAGKEVKFFSCYNTLSRELQERVKEGDVVLVKGSRFHELWKVIDFIGVGVS